MSSGLKRKYGLFTATSMVVGIVIGSGVFFKAENILDVTNGNLPIGIAAWIIGGLIMLSCICMFAVMATKYEKVNGIVDYAEATVGSRYAYALGWFMTIIYYPTLTSVLSWLSARYTLALFGFTDASSGLCLALSCLYLCTSYAVNSLAPIIAGKLQIGATIIKLVPLILMAAAGTVSGLLNGTLADNFAFRAPFHPHLSSLSSLFSGVVSTAFAYEGWIIATSINSELKNSKKNLPIALFFGSVIIILVYLLYYIGLAGSVPIEQITDSTKGVNFAFTSIFGQTAGTILIAFIAVSCIGSLNGLMLGCTRGMYSIAIRNSGPNPNVFKAIDQNTDMPANSAIAGLLLCSIWLFYFYGANLHNINIFGVFGFDSSELPIVTIYAMYIPIFVMYIIKTNEKSILKKFILPISAIISSILMIIAAVYAHGIVPYKAAQLQGKFSMPILSYIIISAVIMLSGKLFMPKHN